MLSGILRETFFNGSWTSVARTVARRDIAREGDEPATVSMLLDGWAARYRQLADGRRQTFAIILPGDMCDTFVSQTGALDHSIGALTDVRIGRIGRGRFEDLLGERPALARAVWRQDLLREAMLREMVVALGRKSASERIAHILAETFLRLRIRGLTDHNSCEFPITQGDIADLLGLTPVHVNRTLRELRREGLIQLAGRRLTIPSLPALLRLAFLDPRYLRHPPAGEPANNAPLAGAVPLNVRRGDAS